MGETLNCVGKIRFWVRNGNLGFLFSVLWGPFNCDLQGCGFKCDSYVCVYLHQYPLFFINQCR